MSLVRGAVGDSREMRLQIEGMFDELRAWDRPGVRAVADALGLGRRSAPGAVVRRRGLAAGRARPAASGEPACVKPLPPRRISSRGLTSVTR